MPPKETPSLNTKPVTIPSQGKGKVKRRKIHFSHLITHHHLRRNQLQILLRSDLAKEASVQSHPPLPQLNPKPGTSTGENYSLDSVIKFKTRFKTKMGLFFRDNYAIDQTWQKLGITRPSQLF